jgi:hypothetical protein
MACQLPLRRSIVARGTLCDQRGLGVGRLAVYQVLERNRQRPSARVEIAEQPWSKTLSG